MIKFCKDFYICSLLLGSIILTTPFVFAQDGHESLTVFEEGQIFKTNKALELPQKLVGKIEEIYLKEYRKRDSVRTDLTKDSELIARFQRSTLNTKVFFENIDNTLKKPLMYNLDQGGGFIDLEPGFKNANPGRVKVRFELEIEAEDKQVAVESMRVFLLSNTKSRTVSKRKWGAGCGKVLDISSLFKSKMLTSEGVILASQDEMYLGALGGTFLIFYSKLSHVFMSAVTFVHRGLPELQCNNLY